VHQSSDQSRHESNCQKKLDWKNGFDLRRLIFGFLLNLGKTPGCHHETKKHKFSPLVSDSSSKENTLSDLQIRRSFELDVNLWVLFVMLEFCSQVKTRLTRYLHTHNTPKTTHLSDQMKPSNKHLKSNLFTTCERAQIQWHNTKSDFSPGSNAARGLDLSALRFL